ncbi:MAG TPA: helix-turn-helix domain-containing protein [Thermomicrobiales bacterium]|nr:helix-turn-helix domain-containing protein [Thermomicrobiales bacterium]
MRKQHVVVLTGEERGEAEAVLRRGTASALTHRHARILLEAAAAPRRPARSDRAVAERCGVSARTVARVRERCATAGCAAALHGAPHPGARPKLDSAQEARLIALACTPAPAGHARWTLRLLAARAVELVALPPVSRELVRTTLNKTPSSPGAANGG